MGRWAAPCLLPCCVREPHCTLDQTRPGRNQRHTTALAEQGVEVMHTALPVLAVLAGHGGEVGAGGGEVVVRIL